MDRVTVEQWVELFCGIGLSDADMHKWYRLFETKYPEAHQSFHKWPGMDDRQIQKVRNI